LVTKITDFVALFLDPPRNEVVLCVDERTQIQALDRTAPILPMRPGLPEKATHDYVRHGTAPPHWSPRWRSQPGRSPTSATTGTATTNSYGS
jgi:hypothetical protein